MPIYQTQWNRDRKPTNPGSPLLPQFIESLDKNGKRYLKKTGNKNIYSKIQEEARGTEIYDIIDKYLQTGDESLLNKRQGIFGNFINIPKSPMEIHQKIIEAEQQFNQLDRTIREEFENDINVFKQSIINGTFEDRIAHYIGKQTKAEQTAELKAKVEGKEEKINE